MEFALKGGDYCLVKIADHFFYYGKGNGGMFVATPDHVLRFNPYLERPAAGELIPDKVLDCIEKYADAAAPFVEYIGLVDTKTLDGEKGDPQEYLRRFKEYHPNKHEWKCMKSGRGYAGRFSLFARHGRALAGESSEYA